MMAVSVALVALLSTLTWSNPVDTTRQVRVEKSSSAYGQYTGIAQLAPGSTTYVDANNTAGTTSCYRLAYQTAGVIGPYTDSVCKTFPKRTGKPQR